VHRTGAAHDISRRKIIGFRINLRWRRCGTAPILSMVPGAILCPLDRTRAIGPDILIGN